MIEPRFTTTCFAPNLVSYNRAMRCVLPACAFVLLAPASDVAARECQEIRRVFPADGTTGVPINASVWVLGEGQRGYVLVDGMGERALGHSFSRARARRPASCDREPNTQGDRENQQLDLATLQRQHRTGNTMEDETSTQSSSRAMLSTTTTRGCERATRQPLSAAQISQAPDARTALEMIAVRMASEPVGDHMRSRSASRGRASRGRTSAAN